MTYWKTGFIDMLSFRTNQPLLHLGRMFPAARLKRNPFKGHFKQSEAYDLGGGRHVIVQSGKQHSSQIWNGRVDVFPSRYESLDALMVDVGKVVPNLSEPGICRLDFTRAFDASRYPWRWFLRRLYVPRWHRFTCYKRGFAIGVNPHRITAYEHKGIDGTICTHLELQLSDGKDACPIQKLDELPDLANYHAYKDWDIRLLDFDNSEIGKFSSLFSTGAGIDSIGGPQVARLEKLHAVRDLVNEHGYFGARRFIDRSGNFSRYEGSFSPAKRVSAMRIDRAITRGISEFCSSTRSAALSSSSAQGSRPAIASKSDLQPQGDGETGVTLNRP